MKVKELKKILTGLDNNKQIIIASDEEGNGFGTIDTNFSELFYNNGEKKEPVIVLYPLHYLNPDDLTDPNVTDN
jgi:hypothetical protein